MGYKDEVIKYHDRYAKSYFSKLDWKFDLLIKYSDEDSLVLDAGCGTGNYSIPLSPHVKSIVGIDITQSMLNEAWLKIAQSDIKNVSIFRADMNRTGLPNNHFDLIFSYSTLYYIKEIKDVIEEIHRVLKPGGKAVLDFGNKYSVENYWSAYCYDIPQFNVSRRDIKKVLADKGLDIIEEKYYQLIPEFFRKNVEVKCPLLKPFAFRMVLVCVKK